MVFKTLRPLPWTPVMFYTEPLWLGPVKKERPAGFCLDSVPVKSVFPERACFRFCPFLCLTANTGGGLCLIICVISVNHAINFCFLTQKPKDYLALEITDILHSSNKASRLLRNPYIT